jgi:8-oxo-dGTP pyrophosphatase MutT (NUDIX family)
MGNGSTVQAAGGVILRRTDGGPLSVALVHRPVYGDWTLPKGKLMPGESHEAAALREVEEETGFVCHLGDDAGRIRYRDRRGRDKVVRYWLMVPLSGEFRPNSEVDEVRWLTVPDAILTLTYSRDRTILERLDEEGQLSGPRP